MGFSQEIKGVIIGVDVEVEVVQLCLAQNSQNCPKIKVFPKTKGFPLFFVQFFPEKKVERKFFFH